MPVIHLRPAFALLALAAAGNALADAPAAGLDIRAGSTGIGADFDVGFGSYVTARVGYSALTYSHNVSTSDVNYSGTLKLSMFSGVLDWNLLGGGFHLSVGGFGDGSTLHVTGNPAGGGYTLNGTFFPSSQIGTVNGSVKFGNAVSPYVGLGWGNPVGQSSHWHFLLDAGVIYGGTPRVSLQASCGAAVPAASCALAQSDAQVERQQLQNDVSLVKWYPVVDLGVAYRF